MLQRMAWMHFYTSFGGDGSDVQPALETLQLLLKDSSLALPRLGGLDSQPPRAILDVGWSPSLIAFDDATASKVKGAAGNAPVHLVSGHELPGIFPPENSAYPVVILSPEDMTKPLFDTHEPKMNNYLETTKRSSFNAQIPLIVIIVASSFEALCKNKWFMNSTNFFIEYTDICIFVSTMPGLPAQMPNSPPLSP